MTQVGQIYKCTVCNNTVEVKAAGVGELICCGQPMNVVVEEAPVTTETTLPKQPEQSMPPVPETPTEESNQEKPQV